MCIRDSIKASANPHKYQNETMEKEARCYEKELQEEIEKDRLEQDVYKRQILRYYFLGFDDTEISKILEVNRSTIQRRRHAGLEFIKKFMEEEA